MVGDIREQSIVWSVQLLGQKDFGTVNDMYLICVYMLPHDGNNLTMFDLINAIRRNEIAGLLKEILCD